MPDINGIWRRIERCQGEEFHTISGLPFTYEVEGNVFRASRAKQNILRTDFERVLEIAPIDGPGEINWEVRGPAYIWAVLHDPRIRLKDY